MHLDAVARYRERIFHALKLDQLSPFVRRVVIGVIGGTILLLGLAMTVLPGPAFIVLPVGLAILASEFAWARRLIRKGKRMLLSARRAVSK